MSRLRSLRQRAWEKSEGVCFLCKLPMLPNAEPGNPLAFTIEHILPRGKGGSNDMDNISGSHQYCNNWKQDELMENLPDGWRRVIRWKIKHLLANMKVDKSEIL